MFVVVAEHGNLTKAAHLLHITQPAVSGHLKLLEESLNVRLFERTATGVRLTRAGLALLPKAQAALAGFSEFRNAAKELEMSAKREPTGPRGSYVSGAPTRAPGRNN